MTSRILPREEWSRLEGVDLGVALPLANPETVQVLVVEDHGQIIGCWGMFSILHAEGVWVHPDHRGKSSVARRLWSQMRAMVQATGARAVVTGADRPEIAALLLRHGAMEVKSGAFVLPVEGV